MPDSCSCAGASSNRRARHAATTTFWLNSPEYVLRDHPVGLDRLHEHPEGVRFGKPEEYRKYERGLLRGDGKPGFATPSGKVEIASSLLAKYGHEALPVYVEPTEGPLASPELAKRFPLVLNTGARIQSTFRSQHLNLL